jgi:quercetin 2,3-dioxygenase
MIQIRRSSERGHADHGWLDSHHTFSFADYYDPSHMGFGDLRVINEDRVAAGGGFPRHGHRDMEIISYVLDGELQHQDSTGGGGVIRPGDVQHMSAGSGVTHSEFNASKTKPVHFLQIWILPNARGVTPRYDQKTFGDERRGKLRLVASPDGKDGSLSIHQDARMYAALLAPGQEVAQTLEGTRAWLQVARGSVAVGGAKLEAGDGAAITDEKVVRAVASADSEILLFDLR